MILAILCLLPIAAAIGANNGSWGPPILLPLVPASAALLHTNELLLWSSYRADVFVGQDDPATSTTAFCTLNLATMAVGPFSVSQPGHDMFCPGTSLLANGTLMVNGGSTSASTTLYHPATKSWSRAANMTIPRGYQGDVTLSDGRVFTIGGSWSGGTAHKDGEVWSPTTGAWSRLPNVLSSAILTDDPKGENTQDNHAWLFARGNGVVFHAGPSKQMNFFGTSGSGTSTPAGLRGTDQHSQYGNAVMFDDNKILTVGGATQQSVVPGSKRAHVITLNGNTVASVEEVAPMRYGRTFHTSVVLPDGSVLVTGGQTIPEIWTDNNAVFVPELYDPASKTFRSLAPAANARTYHSVAVLLPDGTVFTGGGGLCSLTGMQQCIDLYSSHFDGAIFTPPNLLNADGTPASRPVIVLAPGSAKYGSQITVVTNVPVSYFAVIRNGASTHGVNNDQRRYRLSRSIVGTNRYSLSIPREDKLPPGYYMLFAVDSRGVPSKAPFVRIGI